MRVIGGLFEQDSWGWISAGRDCDSERGRLAVRGWMRAPDGRRAGWRIGSCLPPVPFRVHGRGKWFFFSLSSMDMTNFFFFRCFMVIRDVYVRGLVACRYLGCSDRKGGGRGRRGGLLGWWVDRIGLMVRGRCVVWGYILFRSFYSLFQGAHSLSPSSKLCEWQIRFPS